MNLQSSVASGADPRAALPGAGAFAAATTLRCAALMAAAVLVGACGQKGALKLPAAPAAAAAASAGGSVRPTPSTLAATAASTPATR